MKRLRAGPFLDSYRGLNIIHSRQYSLETGAPPRDLLRRRVRVAEYYRIPWSDDFLGQTLVIHHPNAQPGGGGGGAGNLQPNQENATFGNHILVDLYDESKDTFFTVTWQELLLHAALDEEDRAAMMDSLQGNNIVQEDLELLDAAENHPFPLARTNKFVVRLGGDAVTSVLLLQDNPVPPEIRSVTARIELTSFFKNSGLFPLLNSYNGSLVRVANGFADEHLSNFVANVAYPATASPAPVRLPADANYRRRFFTQLMLGYAAPGNQLNNGNANPTFFQHYTDRGFRPNLHVGRMVYPFMKPHAPRFVHVAANIFSQVVVTKKLSNILMDVVYRPDVARAALPGAGQPQPPPNEWQVQDEEMYVEALRVLGVPVPNANVPSFFGVDRSLLVFMTAAVLHPNPLWRSKFRAQLELRGTNIEKIGEQLVVFIKYFISSLPINQQRTAVPNDNVALTGHFFNCFEQGKNVEKIFNKFGGQSVHPVVDNNLLPPLYLGPFRTKNDCIAEYQNLQPNQWGPTHLEQHLLPANWDGGNIDREVRPTDFTGPDPQNNQPNPQRYPGLRGYVYPSKDKIRQVSFLHVGNKKTVRNKKTAC